MTSIDRTARRSADTLRARAPQVVGAIVVDLLAFVLVAALVAAAVSAGERDPAILALLALLALVVGQVRGWSRTGRSLGSVVTGVRRVTTADGAPPGLARALAPGWSADLRRGRDPVEPTPTVPLLPPVAPSAVPPPVLAAAPLVPKVAVAARPSPRVLLVVDGAVTGAIGDGVVLGRNPTSSGDERAVAIADLGREISKAHLALRTDADGRVWAVDRHSTNGSALTRADGATGQLAPGSEIEIGPGDVIRIGSHEISVQFVNEVRVAARCASAIRPSWSPSRPPARGSAPRSPSGRSAPADR